MFGDKEEKKDFKAIQDIDKQDNHTEKKTPWGCLAFVFSSVILLVLGFSLGAYTFPKVQDWLSSHNFLESTIENEDNDESSSNNNSDQHSGNELKVEVTEEELSDIQVIESNMESVVSIAITSLEFLPGEGLSNNADNIGSGFIVDQNGLIVTNQHVVADINSDYIVVASDGSEYEVQDIVRDNVNDIAILKVDATGLNPVELGNSEELVRGQSVIAFGTPLGQYDGSVTKGIISGLNRSVVTSSGSFIDSSKVFENVIQTDAAINPGNSGGPLVNSVGEVVGVNFATTAGANNISFAIPINLVEERLEEYKTYGRFVNPFVGVEYVLISSEDARYYEDVEPGVYVRRVLDGSPADQAGIQRGDIIRSINGEVVDGSFARAIQQFEVDETVDMEIIRTNEEGERVEITVEVTLVEAP